MTEFDVSSIRKESSEDYERSWLDSAKLLRLKGRELEWGKSEGKAHPVVSLLEELRRTMLSYGFDEVMNPMIVEESEIRKQYGPEAYIILDRLFYLAALPRPDIGLSNQKIERIRSIVPSFSKTEEMQKFLRRYKLGEIEGDNFVEEMVNALGIRQEEATQIVQQVFPELKDRTAIPTKQTLRSHMTSLWFPTISRLQEKQNLPLKLFSVGPRFRREQKLDAHHLYESSGLSIVVMAKDITLEDGVDLTKKILNGLGFKDVKFVTKKATSKYYAPGTEDEVYVKHGKEWLEVGDLGFYSPVALANYNIRYPVLNAGFGVERIALIRAGIDDVRKLTYPQFYETLSFTDEDMAKMISFREKPKKRTGESIVKKIAASIMEHKDAIGPKRFLAYKDKDISAYISEPEENKRLLGPAGLNVVYVHEGNIIGVDEKDEKFRDVMSKGVRVCSYIDAISNLFASKVEKRELGRHTVRIADTLHSINLEVESPAERYMTSNGKRIDVRGPIFVDIEIEKN